MKKSSLKVVKIDKNKSLFNYEKKILIKELTLDLKLGYYEFEKEKPQKVKFSLEIDYEDKKPTSDKDIKSIVNYGQVVKLIKKLTKNKHYNFLETLAENVFDILFKVLKCKYGNKSVTYVRNITDIDDKIIKSSEEKKISITELTSNIIKKFHEDCKYLNCETPTHEPKATDNIELMISMINDLIKGEFAYESEQHVYLGLKNLKIMECFQIKMLMI